MPNPVYFEKVSVYLVTVKSPNNWLTSRGPGGLIKREMSVYSCTFFSFLKAILKYHFKGLFYISGMQIIIQFWSNFKVGLPETATILQVIKISIEGGSIKF